MIAKNKSSLGGFEPPTFRLTAERANRLRHRDGRYEFMTPLEDFLPTEAVNRNNMYAFHLRPRGSNGTVAVRLIVVVWPVRSMHRAAVLVLLAGETSLSGSP